MRMRLAAAAVLVVAVAGCQGTEGGSRDGGATLPPPSPATGSASPAPSRTFETTDVIEPEEALEAKSGKQFIVVASPSASMPGGRTATPLGLTEAGELIVAANPLPQVGGEEVKIGQSEVGIQGPRQFRPFERSSRKSDQARQAVYAAESSGTVAWVETASTDMFYFDWRVYSANEQGGRRARLLGDSAVFAPRVRLPRVPGSSAPTMGGGRAYWASPYPTSDARKFGVKILSRPLDGSNSLAAVADRAKLPAAAGDKLYYIRSEDVSPGFTRDQYEIHELSQTVDAVVVSGALAGDEQVTMLSANGTHLSWVVSSPDKSSALLYYLDSRTHKALAFKLAHAGPPTMYLSLSSTILAWSNGSAAGDAGQYVYDIPRRRLWRLGVVDGYSVIFAKGDFIAWSELSSTDAQAAGKFRVGKWTHNG